MEAELRNALDQLSLGNRQKAVLGYLAAAEMSTEPDDLVLFALTETEFRALSPQQREALLTDWIELSGDLRALSRAVVEEARTAAHAGDLSRAERYLNAVERVGRALAESDRALLAQETGRALVQGVKRARSEF